MGNRFNFIERFVPLSSLQLTIVEFDDGRFIVAPEGLISCSLQDDRVVGVDAVVRWDLAPSPARAIATGRPYA